MAHTKNGGITDAIAKDWERLDKQALGRLAYVMHESTLAGVDGAEDYVPSIDKKDAIKQIGILKRRMLSVPGDDKWPMLAEIRTLKKQIRFEERREQACVGIQRIFQAVASPARSLSDLAGIAMEGRNTTIRFCDLDTTG